MSSNSRCPLCGTGGILINRFALKGFDDTLTVIKTVNIESRKSDELPVDPLSDSDFEDLPPFSTSH